MSKDHQRGIRFKPRQIEWLEQEAKRLCVSVAEVVRRLIDREMDKPK